MTISKNIATYRKRKGYTQEQLGDMLGVSNQAVSKWESAVSLPDVMLLPRIAETLGITLDELYGLEQKSSSAKVKADEFPRAANERLIEFFRINAKETFRDLKDPWSLVCLSDTEGGAFISENFSLLDCHFKRSGEEEVFSSPEVLSAMKKLANRNVVKVLSYMYKDSFEKKETWNQSYTLSSVVEKCALSEDEALDALDALYSLKILERDMSGHTTEYYFLKFRGFLVLSVFKNMGLLIRETFMYEVLRDTSQINDYAFFQ